MAETLLERWEAEAEAFHAATGYIQPGKDVPAAMNPSDEYMRERQIAWKAWCAGASYVRRALAREKKEGAE